jgi:hypothetical protein
LRTTNGASTLAVVMRTPLVAILALLACAPAALADSPPGIGTAMRAAAARLPLTSRDRPMSAARARTIVGSVLRQARLTPDAVTCRPGSRLAASCTVRATSVGTGTAHWSGTAQVRVGAQVLVSYSLTSLPSR